MARPLLTYDVYPPYHKPMASQPQEKDLPEGFQKDYRMRSPVQGRSCLLICKDELSKLVAIKLPCMHAACSCSCPCATSLWRTSSDHLTIRSQDLISKRTTNSGVAPMTLCKALLVYLDPLIRSETATGFCLPSYLQAHIFCDDVEVDHWKTSSLQLARYCALTGGNAA